VKVPRQINHSEGRAFRWRVKLIKTPAIAKAACEGPGIAAGVSEKFVNSTEVASFEPGSRT
jgi:hypothetical protein